MDQSLPEVIRHLYDNAAAFKARMNAADLTPDDLQAEDDLAKLPIFRKDDLIALQAENPPFGGLLASPMSALSSVYQSPGPIHEPMIRGSDIGNWGVALKAAGFAEGEVVINALGYHMTPAGASIQSGLNFAGCVVIPGGIGNMEQQIQAIIAFNATGYAGLPSYLNALLDKAKSLGYELPLNKAFLLAEPLPPSLRASLEERGIRTFQAYGTAECGNLGYDTPEMNGWHVPSNVILQICDINTGQPLPAGETGEVVATLLNPHYAATIRFGVGDLSAIIPDSLNDGGPVRIAGWQGRVGGAAKVRGMFLHPVQLGSMMKRFSDKVARYQAVITRENHRDNLDINLVLVDGASSDRLTQLIEEAARDNIKFKLNAHIVSADDIPADAAPIQDNRNWDE